MEKTLDLTKYIKEDYISKEIEEKERLQLEVNNQTLQTKEQEKESEKSGLLQVKANYQILMPEQGVGKAAFAENYTEHVSAKKRQRKLKMHDSALHKKAVNAQQLEAAEGIWQNEVQKKWEIQTKVLKNLKQFDDSKKTEQEEAFAQFLESEGITFGIHWTHYLSNIDNLEKRKESENFIVSYCIQQYMKMDFHLDWRNDETFVKESVRMNEIYSKTEALKYLLDKHQDIVNVLSEEDKVELEAKLNMGTKISEYYKVQKNIIKNPYYRTHYNSEITRNYNEKDTSEQKELAIMLRRAEYFKDTDKVSPLFLGTKFDMDQLRELLNDPAAAQKHNIGWEKLLEETKDKEESFIVRNYIENELIKERIAMLTYAEQYKNSEVKSYPEEQYAGAFLANYFKNKKWEYGATFMPLLEDVNRLEELEEQLKAAKESDQRESIKEELKWEKSVLQKKCGFYFMEEVDSLIEVYKKIKLTGERYYDYIKEREKVLEIRKRYESQLDNRDAHQSVLKTLEDIQIEYETELEKIVNKEGAELFDKLMELIKGADLWTSDENKDFVNKEVMEDVHKALANRANQYQDYISIQNQVTSTNLAICVQRSPLFDYLKSIQANTEIILKEGVDADAFKDMVAKYNEEYTHLEYLNLYLKDASDRNFVVDLTVQIDKGERICIWLEDNIKKMIEFRSNSQEANKELLKKDISIDKQQASGIVQKYNTGWKGESAESNIDEVIVKQLIEKEVTTEIKKEGPTDQSYVNVFFSYFKNQKPEYCVTLEAFLDEDMVGAVIAIEELEKNLEKEDTDNRKILEENLEKRVNKFEKDFGFRSIKLIHNVKIIHQKVKQIGGYMYWYQKTIEKSLEMAQAYKNSGTNMNKAFMQTIEKIQKEYETFLENLIKIDGTQLFEEVSEFVEKADIWVGSDENKDFINNELQGEIERALADRAKQYQDYIPVWNQATSTNVGVCIQRSPLFDYLKDAHVNTEIVLKTGIDADAFKDAVAKYNEEYTRLEYLKSHLNNEDAREFVVDITFQIHKSQRVSDALEQNIKNMLEYRNTENKME